MLSGNAGAEKKNKANAEKSFIQRYKYPIFLLVSLLKF